MELVLPINLIGADSPDRGPELFELGGQITEMAALFGSTRCLGLDEEEQDEGTLSQQSTEGGRLARVIDGLEVLDHFSDVEHLVLLALVRLLARLVEPMVFGASHIIRSDRLA